MPLLERAALKHEGRFKLVKANIDNLPEVATALGIKSVPSVFLVHKGNMIDTFQGTPTPSRLQEFLDTALLMESMGHDERVISTLLAKAQEFLDQGQFEPAENMYLEGDTYEQWRDRFGPEIKVGLAACAFFKEGKKDVKRAQGYINEVTSAQRANLPDFYKMVLQRLEEEIVSL
jgi:thioredoxin-like negative regulator of GroEL